MLSESVAQTLSARHGVIAAYPQEFFGYFGWPSVARLADNTLAAVASGLRHAHVCPFGRTVICFSRDQGETWTAPRVVNDLPLDDRDAGITALGGNRLLVSWFTSDTRTYNVLDRDLDEATRARYIQGLAAIDDAAVERWLGSWVRVSEDGGATWGSPARAPVTAPHGPIVLADGSLLYVGKVYGKTMEEFTVGRQVIRACRSTDSGRTWTDLGSVPLYPETADQNYHEPHVAEVAPGTLLGLIRLQNHKRTPGLRPLEELGLVHFSLMQTRSTDNGRTWTPAEPLGFHGSPPHLLRHSSGALVCVCGYRQKPYGQRVAISHDAGASWQHDYILRDDGPDGDLGYPASVELADGSLLTVYYQKPATTGDKCGLLCSRWELPG